MEEKTVNVNKGDIIVFETVRSFVEGKVIATYSDEYFKVRNLGIDGLILGERRLLHRRHILAVKD